MSKKQNLEKLGQERASVNDKTNNTKSTLSSEDLPKGNNKIEDARRGNLRKNDR